MKNIFKKTLSICLAFTLVFALFSVSTYAATGSYTRPLPTLNIIGGRSMEVTVSAPSIPPGAVITNVTLTGSRSGTGIVTWQVKHNVGGLTSSLPYSTSGASTKAFNPLTPNTTWTIYVSSPTDYTTITNGQLKVEYSY